MPKIFKKLNTAGAAHIIIPLVAIVGFALVGTYMLVASHADTVTAHLSGTSYVDGTTSKTAAPGQTVTFKHTISLNSGAPTQSVVYGVRWSVNGAPVAYPAASGGACAWPNSAGSIPSFSTANCTGFINQKVSMTSGETLANSNYETAGLTIPSSTANGTKFCEWMAFYSSGNGNGASNQACVTVSISTTVTYSAKCTVTVSPTTVKSGTTATPTVNVTNTGSGTLAPGLVYNYKTGGVTYKQFSSTLQNLAKGKSESVKLNSYAPSKKYGSSWQVVVYGSAFSATGDKQGPNFTCSKSFTVN